MNKINIGNRNTQINIKNKEIVWICLPKQPLVFFSETESCLIPDRT